MPVSYMPNGGIYNELMVKGPYRPGLIWSLLR
jgi:hypothetical protein